MKFYKPIVLITHTTATDFQIYAFDFSDFTMSNISATQAAKFLDKILDEILERKNRVGDEPKVPTDATNYEKNFKKLLDKRKIVLVGSYIRISHVFEASKAYKSILPQKLDIEWAGKNIFMPMYKQWGGKTNEL